MNIAFLSSLNPTDIHSWSGILYFMFNTLQCTHHVDWIGGKQYTEVYKFHILNYGQDAPFKPERYSLLFGKLLSDLFRYTNYDIIICRDYFFLANLITDIPVIYIGDTTFRLFNCYMKIKDIEFIQLADEIERRAIQKATHLVYSSKWAMNSAINDYCANPEKISVIEFGANIINDPEHHIPCKGNICNLLYIGMEWTRKGGEKAINIYRFLKEQKFPCSLTMIGDFPEEVYEYNDIFFYPHIDKSTLEGRKLFDRILSQSNYLIAPTSFECFGIMYCEASAYGIPILTNDVCGVDQSVIQGVNGFLFSLDTSVEKWADIIINNYGDEKQYVTMCKKVKKEFRARLNWKVWGQRMNSLISNMCAIEKICLPIYIISMRDNKEIRKHIIDEFADKNEFEIHLIEADVCGRMNIEYWDRIVEVIKDAQIKKEKYVIICDDDHCFTENYSSMLLLKEIKEAFLQNAEIISGGVGGFGQAIPVGYHRYWVAWFRYTQFIIVFASLYDRILSYKFKENDNADNVLSHLAKYKMVIYPFISQKVNLNYLDIGSGKLNKEIQENFEMANEKFRAIEYIYNRKLL